MHEIKDEPHCSSTATSTSAVDALVGMIKIWEGSGFLQEESQRKEADYLDDVLKSNLSQINDEASIRELHHAAARLQKSLSLVVPTLEKFRQLVLSEAERATGRVRDMSLMCGMTLLSDDIVSGIFDTAVRESGAGVRSATTAIQLARVSKRFRSVALSNHSLWTFIYCETYFGDLQFSHIKLCLERSAHTPIEVFYNIGNEADGTPAFNRFMKIVLPHAIRWKSFAVKLVHGGDMTPIVKVCDAIANMESVSAPILDKLGTLSCSTPHTRSNVEVPIPFSKWSLPNLKGVELQDLSLNLHAFPSLTRVSETIYMHNFNTRRFFADLMALSPLRYLYLGFVGEEISQDHQHLDLPSLTELSLYPRVRPSKPLDGVLTALNCPNVTDLSVKLLYIISDEDLWCEDKREATQHYVRQLFAFPGCFRKVSNLTLIVMLSECADPDEGDLGHTLYVLPLPHLPNLRHLTLQGTLVSLRPQKNKSETQVFEIEEGKTYTAIETISVRSARPDRLHYWLAKIMKQLETQGDWDRCFKHLVLRGRHRTARSVVALEVERFPRSAVGEWISSSAKLNSG